MKCLFRPEFLNRLDNVIVFRSLTKDEITEIVDIMFHTFKSLLDERCLPIRLRHRGQQVLVDKGYDPQFRARPAPRDPATDR